MHGAAVHIHPARSLREAFKIEKKSVNFVTLFLELPSSFRNAKKIFSLFFLFKRLPIRSFKGNILLTAN